MMKTTFHIYLASFSRIAIINILSANFEKKITMLRCFIVNNFENACSYFAMIKTMLQIYSASKFPRSACRYAR